MDILNQYLADKKAKEGHQVVSALQFKRGGHMSIQASSGHYCSPKNDTGPYSMVEVLVTSPRMKIPKSFGTVKPDEDGYRQFNFVPVSAVVAEIKRRGGIANA